MRGITRILNIQLLILLCGIFLIGVANAEVAQSQKMQMNWDARFHLSGFNGDIYASKVFDGKLFIVGDFTHFGNQQLNYIAAWDGERIHAVGGGLNAPAYTLEVFADQFSAGNNKLTPKPETNLFVGGDFTEAGGKEAKHIAKWNGENWHSLDVNLSHIQEGLELPVSVRALKVYDENPIDPTVGKLYVGGVFNRVGDVKANNIVAWDGSTWSHLNRKGITGSVFGWGTGVSIYPRVNTMAVYDNKLYIGGRFEKAGWRKASNLAVWDGIKLSALNHKRFVGFTDVVLSMEVYDNQLVVGGRFDTLGGRIMNSITIWDGNDFNKIGFGLSGGVAALHTTIEEGEEILYAGGFFNDAKDQLAKWQNGRWNYLGAAIVGAVWSINTYQEKLYVLGRYNDAQTGQRLDFATFNNKSAWNKSVIESSFVNKASWDQPIFEATGYQGQGLGQSITEFAVFDEQLFVAGPSLSVAGDLMVNRLASWNGKEWNSVAGGVAGRINDLLATNDQLLVAGSFTQAGDIEVNNIAAWDGEAWLNLGFGLNGTAGAMANYNDSLYVAGNFSQAGDADVNNVASWDGQQWQAVGKGLQDSWEPEFNAMTVYDDQLIVAGNFSNLGSGEIANNIAAWDGQQWQTLASGVSGDIKTLAVYNNRLYVAGNFQFAGDVQIDHGVAMWNGLEWSSVDIKLPENAKVSAMQVVNVDDVDFLQVAYQVDQTLNNHQIITWDGGVTETISGVFNGAVNVLTLFDDGEGAVLYVGGHFSSINKAIRSDNIARHIPIN